MNVGIYVRVSTSAQALDGESIESQKRYGIEFCEGKNYSYRIFEDGGISGADVERRLGYQDLIESIKLKEIDIVWTFSTSRLNRDIANQTILFREIQKHGVRLFVGSQEYDFDNAQDKLMLNVLSIFDDYFRVQNTYAIVKGKQRLLRDGKWVTGSTLFGYNIIDDGYRIVVNEKEKEVLNRMVDLAIEGNSYSDISKSLKVEYGTSIDRDNKKYKFTDTFVHRLFHKNYFMVGYYEYSIKGVAQKFEFEPIVSKEKYDRAVLLLGITAKTKREKLVTYLEGHVVCGECGGNLTASRQWGKVRKDGSRSFYYYWRCHRKKRTSACRQISIKTNALEDHIDYIIQNILNDRRFVEEELVYSIQDKYREYYKSRDSKNDNKIYRDIGKEKDKLNRLKELYVEGEISKDYFNTNKRLIENKINALEVDLTPSSNLEESDFINIIEMFKEISNLQGMDSESFFKNYIEKLVVNVEEVRSRFDKKYGFKFIWKGINGENELISRSFYGKDEMDRALKKKVIVNSASLTQKPFEGNFRGFLRLRIIAFESGH